MGVTVYRKIDIEAVDTIRIDITFETSLVCRLESEKQTVKNIAKRSSFLERNRVKKFSISCLTSLCASLRSSGSPASAISRCHQLSVLRVCRSTFGTRAFSVAGPIVWNSLPDHLRDSAVDSEQFRRNLKTYLFAGHSKR